jgi:hypothetical protein
MSDKSTRSIYSVHPSVAYAQSIINNLPKTTGKSIEEWIALVKKSGPRGEKERRDWLKKNYKLGGTTAWMIVDRVEGKGAEDTDPEAYLKSAVEFVEAMYAGAKAALRPIHDALINLGMSLGGDVKICPCQTIVPFYREHVFAQIKPATRTRIDFGLALKGAKKKPPRRLIDTGGLAKGDRITHRIEITSENEINDEVKTWLKMAYDLDA